MKRTITAIATLCFTAFLLTSCAEVVSTLIESDMHAAVENGQKSRGSHPTSKQQAKEAERLRQQGKCPACNGMGRTPDGRYTCTECKGTGKYVNKETD